MSRKLLVILLVFGLLVGNLAIAPVVRGGTGAQYVLPWTSTALVNVKYETDGNGKVQFWMRGDASAGGYNIGLVTIANSVSVNGSTAGIQYCYAVTTGAVWPASSYDGYQIITSSTLSAFPAGSTVTIVVSGASREIMIGSGTGDFMSCPGVTYVFTMPSSSGWVVAQFPPSVSIAGPAMVETGQSGTWTATAAGGTAPYTYEWYLLPAGSSLLGDDPGLIATGTASTFTHTMTVAGAFQVSLTVLDSTGAAVAATATVNVGATLGTGYRIEFARSGTRGLYLAVSVYDGITGIISPIASTSGTQAGWYDDWGTTTNSFHWVASPSEAVWWQAFSWRWTLRFAYPDGSLGPPPEDFWFQTTITLTNGTHLSVMHHFSTYGENSDTWTDDTGAVAVPETPPVAESSLPAWVQALLDGFKAVIRWAFVPSATDFSSQVAQGWVVITSPVPTIVPQYTIPFPNPNHLLASTGDSVNIDFSMISTWTYYATVKALVQVCLDAVLVFIVIGMVT